VVVELVEDVDVVWLLELDWELPQAMKITKEKEIRILFIFMFCDGIFQK